MGARSPAPMHGTHLLDQNMYYCKSLCINFLKQILDSLSAVVYVSYSFNVKVLNIIAKLKNILILLGEIADHGCNLLNLE